MRKTTSIFTIVFALTLASCVTVKLANEPGQKASGVEYKAPPKPFEKDSRNEVDAAWKNSKNGNVISYLSDCNDPTDPPLEQIVAGITSGLADLKVMEESSPMVQDREAKRVHASGKVDGVPSEIELLAFKRNHCIYILSYIGVKKAFSENRAEFNRFVDGFKAP